MQLGSDPSSPVVHKNQSPRDTSRQVVVTQIPPPLRSAVVQMGSSASNIDPGKDLLDLHGRVAIVTGAKYVVPSPLQISDVL